MKTEISSTHIEKIIEAGFDWLIGNHKVAVKVYLWNYYFSSEK